MSKRTGKLSELNHGVVASETRRLAAMGIFAHELTPSRNGSDLETTPASYRLEIAWLGCAPSIPLHPGIFPSLAMWRVEELYTNEHCLS
jgi:hypothetical protein